MFRGSIYKETKGSSESVCGGSIYKEAKEALNPCVEDQFIRKQKKL